METTNSYISTHTSLKAEFSVPYEYEIHFTNDLFGLENRLIANYFSKQKLTEDQNPKVVFMIDQGVADHHPDMTNRIQEYFETLPQVRLIEEFYIFPGGEVIKNDRESQEEMLNIIDRHSIDRHSYVIAIGGGAILDAVGYAAAISHRGVRHIRIPTTVLSQNDSGIGVKNGINYFSKKNYLGSFTPPEAVWNDVRFLATLSDRDKRAGLAEAIKVALIKDGAFFDWLEQHAPALEKFQEQSMQKSIVWCAKLHLRHITTTGDPFERGSARPLDFGHWAAHKLEDLTNYTIRHGEAVALGIMLDAIYSSLLGYIDRESTFRIRALIQHLGFNPIFEFLNGIEADQLLEGLEEFREHLGGKLTVTLLRGIGEGFEVHEIDINQMKKAFQHLIQSESYHEN